MSFLSYCFGFYQSEMNRLEGCSPTDSELYRARQLLRILDDLADEGYTALNERLETAHCGATRLLKYLSDHRAEPFPPVENQLETAPLPYSAQEIELSSAISQAVSVAAGMPDAPHSPFVHRLRQFCRWIGYAHGTAYIFLLRDTLLPFVYCLGQGRRHIYPWLLSRSSLAALTAYPAADDALRACIYTALENGCTDHSSFFSAVLPEMRKTIDEYPQARSYLASMLANINAERIIVVESGCSGTFPLLLMALDRRVDIRMYTTYPYLTNAFGARVFTSRYEENRQFETMASQALYFRFAGLQNGRFYVQRCMDAAVETRALTEIRTILRFGQEDLPRCNRCQGGAAASK